MRALVEALKYACHRARSYRESTDPARRCDTCKHFSVNRESFCKKYECKVDPHAVCEAFEVPGKGGTKPHRGPSIRTLFGLGK